MPNKFKRPTDPAHALYHDVLCGNLSAVQTAITEPPELIRNQPVVAGAWSHGGRRCCAEDDVIECLWLIHQHGASFQSIGVDTLDSAFKAFPRAARMLLGFGVDATVADSDGTTALHRMVEIGYRSAAEDLLRFGSNINAKTTSGWTPLDVAARLGLPRMICFLRDRGAQSSATSLATEQFTPIERHIETIDRRWTGEVAWFRADRGYGYLRDQSLHGGELFFDVDDALGTAPESIEEGTALSYEMTHDEFGLRAVHVDFGSVRR